MQIDIGKLFGRRWVDDSEAVNCTHCGKEFSLTIRKVRSIDLIDLINLINMRSFDRSNHSDQSYINYIIQYEIIWSNRIDRITPIPSTTAAAADWSSAQSVHRNAVRCLSLNNRKGSVIIASLNWTRGDLIDSINRITIDWSIWLKYFHSYLLIFW